MKPETWSQIDSYYNDLFLDEHEGLKQALIDSEAAGLDPIAVAPNQGKLLYLLAKVKNAKRILEIGTLGGYSTIWMAKALPQDGKLITLEIDQKCAEVAQKNIDRAGVANQIEIVQGNALEEMIKLHQENTEPFDLIFIDADKENNPGYFEYSMKLAKAGTLIIADNVIRKGEVINKDSDDPKIHGIWKFNELIQAEKRVETTVIQTVGSKGYDGLGLIFVKDP